MTKKAETAPKARGEWLFVQIVPNTDQLDVFSSDFRKIASFSTEDYRAESVGEWIGTRASEAPELLRPIKES
jgi:hypothetical protein